MAGILGYDPSTIQGGILGGVAPQMASWQQPVGMFGAALKDAGAYLSGHPSDANSVQQYGQQMRQYQMQQGAMQAVQAAQSSDPATSQQGYAAMVALGMDPTPIQKLKANAALPQLMQNLQPSMGFNDNPVGVTPAVNAGAATLPQRQAAEALNAAPAMSMQPATLAGALQRTGSPELTAEMAPQMIQSQLAAQTKMLEPYTLNPGDRRMIGNQIVASAPLNPTPNQPFNPDGTPNKAYQAYQESLKKAEQAPQWARLNFEKEKLSSGIPNEDALHDMAVRYVQGDKNAFGAMGRNPRAQTAAQNMISQVGQELGLKPQQISQNQQTFQAGTKAVQAFDTGKQGDTVRSLNVSVAHLETLKELGAALQNGDVRLINAAQQKFAEEFGVPAPTNFDAAKSIVADEVAKGVIGGQTAQQDRETLAASLRRTGSPQAINGAINTFQELLSGQLHGLRKQYETSTGRSDFNDKLFPSTLAAIDRAPVRGAGKPIPAPQSLPQLDTKIIGGKTYVKQNGQWYEK